MLLALLGALGCERKNQQPSAAPASAAAPAPTGSIRGRVRFRGALPEKRQLDRHSDPYCEQSPRLDESLVVGPDRGLRDVLARLSGALPAPPPVSAAPVVFEQRDCAYLPRVQGARPGQRALVRNHDGTLHNVHLFRGTQTLLNRPQKEGSEPVGLELPGPPALVEVKCDVHLWMLAHLWLIEHPWFAATGADGRFELREVPAGKRTLSLWHEALGAASVEVEIPPGGTAEIDLELPSRQPNNR